MALRVYLFAFSNLRSKPLPRLTASSMAAWAVFLPDQIASISSLMMSRICTKLPKRSPFDFDVGVFKESCLIAVSVPGSVL